MCDVDSEEVEEIQLVLISVQWKREDSDVEVQMKENGVSLDRRRVLGRSPFE